MGSPLLCVYPKMSEVVKEAADVVLLQPATEKPGLHEDLSLHTEIDCDASGCPGCLRLSPRSKFKCGSPSYPRTCYTPLVLLHFWHILAQSRPISGMMCPATSRMSLTPTSTAAGWETHGNSLCSPPGHVTGPRIRQLHRQSAKNDGSGSCWLLTTS